MLKPYSQKISRTRSVHNPFHHISWLKSKNQEVTQQNTGLSWSSFSPPSVSICLALSLWGSDMHCRVPCISSTLTISYLDVKTEFIAFLYLYHSLAVFTWSFLYSSRSKQSPCTRTGCLSLFYLGIVDCSNAFFCFVVSSSWETYINIIKVYETG